MKTLGQILDRVDYPALPDDTPNPYADLEWLVAESISDAVTAKIDAITEAVLRAFDVADPTNRGRLVTSYMEELEKVLSSKYIAYAPVPALDMAVDARAMASDIMESIEKTGKSRKKPQKQKKCGSPDKDLLKEAKKAYATLDKQDELSAEKEKEEKRKKQRREAVQRYRAKKKAEKATVVSVVPDKNGKAVIVQGSEE